MKDRRAVVIDPHKGEEFEQFLKDHAKDQEFWRSIRATTYEEIDKDELDRLFGKLNKLFGE